MNEPMPALRAARARARVGGRPPSLSAKDLRVAKAMLKDPTITVASLATRLNIAASTLYRHTPMQEVQALKRKQMHDD
ncbi:helix-turn-helix domain-containing protein [Nitrosovibrio tenuis]|uniref:helix-turn-helix domain-containing protein n=1 Tax=Nitrosovibrio tenuis TaxID=1233 RepID=UPI001C432D79|nr:helix-turn-helix domain-containing protein [Nitrosovibrio tenuis]